MLGQGRSHVDTQCGGGWSWVCVGPRREGAIFFSFQNLVTIKHHLSLGVGIRASFQLVGAEKTRIKSRPISAASKRAPGSWPVDSFRTAHLALLFRELGAGGFQTEARGADWGARPGFIPPERVAGHVHARVSVCVSVCVGGLSSLHTITSHTPPKSLWLSDLTF